MKNWAGNGFWAGSELEKTHRRAAIESADYLLAWFSDRSDAWWGDLVCAQSLGKPVFIGDDGEPPSYMTDAFFLARVKGQGFHHLGGHSSLHHLARLFWTHDREMLIRQDLVGDELLEKITLTESPIEERLLLHLHCALNLNANADVVPQVQILNYRVDLVVSSERYEAGEPFEPVRICIEADGHEFHERTKEQAARDKKRDRDMAAEGWTVLRFTGSEIWNNPQDCAQQVMRILEKRGATF